MIAVLRNPTYAKLFGAQVIALVGTGLLTVALGLLAFDIAKDNAGVVLGLAMTIKMVAYVGVSPIATALTARFSRKKLLIGTDLARALVAASLPFVSDPWQIYVLIFLLQSASATFTPAFQALIPSVLPDEDDYTRALSLSRLAYDLESLLSPLLAAALLTVISYHNLFVGTVIGFLTSAALILATSLPKVETIESTGFIDRVTKGTRVFWAHPELRGLLSLNLTIAAATAMVIINTVVLVQGELGRQESDVALMLGAYGGGSLIIAFWIPKLLERYTDHQVMTIGGLLLPLALCAVVGVLNMTGGQPQWLCLLILWAVLGAATSAILTPSARLLRRNSTEQNRPAVFAAQFSLSHACYLITYPLAGILGAQLGLSATLIVLAIIAASATAITLTTWNKR